MSSDRCVTIMLGGSFTAMLLVQSALGQAVQQSTPAAASQSGTDKSGAQTAPTADQSNKDSDLSEIVVTGTLIRNIAPAGTQVIGLNKVQVAATGAVSTDQLLASVPQVANFFNTLPSVGTGFNTSLQINRPNLRNLPVSNTASGAATLILVDGHRVVGVGVNQDVPDPDLVPPEAIERVEIDTDGGSSTYGADAVGGVINFITKSHFDGVQTDLRYGTADGYNTVDVAGMVGRDWGSGSAYLSYDYTYHDSLYGRDRDYIKRIDWTTGIPSDRNCATPNVTVGSHTYAVPGLVQGTFNACDLGKDATFYPQEDRHSVYAGFSQELSDSIKFEFRGFYTQREDTSNSGAGLGTVVTISPTNPFYRNLVGTSDANKPQNVDLSFSPIFGNAFERQTTKFDEWGLTPTVSIDLFDDWQVRGMFNYGQSETEYFSHNIETNTALINQYVNGTTIATAINPYDIASTPNKQLLSNLGNWESTGKGNAGLLNARVIADGGLFALPGGTLHAAFGTEYIRDTFKVRSGMSVLGGESGLPTFSYSRDVKAAFGELQIPVFGEDFTLPFVKSLNISASARYDDYSDFGHTYNPRVGVSLKPVDWINLRGNWGTSFNAPTPVDQLASLNNTLVQGSSTSLFPPPNVALPTGAQTLVLTGSRPGLQPQTADTRSFGIDIVNPPVLPGVAASISYYYIDFQGTLGQAPFFNQAIFYQNYQPFYILNPTRAQIAAFGALAVNGANLVAPLLAPGAPPVFELIDFRRTNLGNAKISGLDWSVKYSMDTDFGSVDAVIAGNNKLKNFSTSGVGRPWINQIATGTSLFDFSTTVGANIGDLRAQVTLNHTQGYNVAMSSTLPQTHVDSFNLVNLYFRYDLSNSGWSWAKDMSISLNVDNVFDTDPPIYKQTGTSLTLGGLGSGYANGATLGRLFEFGLSKAF